MSRLIFGAMLALAVSAVPMTKRDSTSVSPFTGFTYSPYNNDGTCKDQAAVQSDIDTIASKGMTSVRLYGTDCNQIALVKAALPSDMTMMVGIFDMSDLSGQVASALSQLDYSCDNVFAVSIGNELVHDGEQTPAAMVANVNSARSQLQAGGCYSPVVTVETPLEFEEYAELADCSDFVAANIQPFYNTANTALSSGEFVLGQIQILEQYGKSVVVTEVGWPSSGETNGAAVPSKWNQLLTVLSVQETLGEQYAHYFFSAFDNFWKSPGYLEVEQSFGIISE